MKKLQLVVFAPESNSTFAELHTVGAFITGRMPWLEAEVVEVEDGKDA